MDGLLNIYKERGFTSHDVVAKLRGILKQKKIGHTGTLDPDAEGVLPVCLGKATKVCDLLADKDKTYRAVLLLGKETDTQDATGQVLKESPVEVSEEAVKQAVMEFVGSYDQIPPMYSALKVGGKKLYELARQGKEVERAARTVKIYGIELESIELPRVTMTVSCSKGTYIRTLCHDIGRKLGCGGCMEALLRTQVSQFTLSDARKLSEVEAIWQAGELETILTKVDTLFSSYPAYRAKEGTEKLLYNGNPMAPAQLDPETGEGETIRLYAPDGQFMGIYAYDEVMRRFRPVKLFYSGEDAGWK